MIDENRQAEALRRALDQELAGVRATPEARERLDSRITPQLLTRRPRRELRRFPGSLVLPLAAASVVAAVVAVPALLRTDDSVTVPPAGGAPSIAPPATTTSGPPQELAPVPRPSQTAGTEPQAPNDPGQSRTGARLSLKASPTPAVVDQRMVLTLRGVQIGPGDVTVNWGDGGRSTKIPGNCTVSARAPMPTLAHTYTAPGQYVIKVANNNCRTVQRANLRVSVEDQPSVEKPSGVVPGADVPSAGEPGPDEPSTR